MKRIRKKRILAGGIVLSLIAVWLWWGNTAIQVSQIELRSEKISIGLDGFKIVQVADLHNDEFGKNQETLLNAIRQAAPDIIAVTGDLIDSTHTNVARAMEFIKGAVAIAPVYFVTGNHEAWSSQYPKLKEQMLLAGVKILEDEAVPLKKDGAVLNLIGINDLEVPKDAGYEGADRATRVDILLKDLVGANTEFTLLLSHRPELFDVYAANKIDLVLSGHAHGGQIRLPLLGGLVAPDQGFFPKYADGQYSEQGTHMIVSRGLGNSIIPLRVNNPPNLVVITLKRK
ncbi:MAG: metallophosphoesterase [Clostridiaceae bacterium]